MKGSALFFTISRVVEFLESEAQKSSTPKFFEVQSALILALAISRKRGEEHLIGFPGKERLRREFNQMGGSHTLASVLSKYVDEDSPNDFYLIPKAQYENPGKLRQKVFAFQLKRMFSSSPTESVEDRIVNFLNTVPKKYAKAPNTNLVLLLTSKPSDVPEFGQVNVGNIRDRLRFEVFPFDRIFFTGFQTDNTLVFGEIWPNFGSDIYPVEESTTIEILAGFRSR